jgi:hypothetical protein
MRGRPSKDRPPSQGWWHACDPPAWPPPPLPPVPHAGACSRPAPAASGRAALLRALPAGSPALKPIGYSFSYLAFRIWHEFPIWQLCVGSSFQQWPSMASSKPRLFPLLQQAMALVGLFLVLKCFLGVRTWSRSSAIHERAHGLSCLSNVSFIASMLLPRIIRKQREPLVPVGFNEDRL